jgi:hypothetical protein
MHRTIAAAAIVFALAAFALQHAALGPLEEPVLLLSMGTLFLLFARLLAPHARKQQAADTEPQDEPAPSAAPSSAEPWVRRRA